MSGIAGAGTEVLSKKDQGQGHVTKGQISHKHAVRHMFSGSFADTAGGRNLCARIA